MPRAGGLHFKRTSNRVLCLMFSVGSGDGEAGEAGEDFTRNMMTSKLRDIDASLMPLAIRRHDQRAVQMMNEY